VLPIGDDNSDRQRWPVVTAVLIGLNVLVFLYEWSLSWHTPYALEAFIRQWGVVPLEYHVGADLPPTISPLPWFCTLVTAMFLHGGWGHLGGNMLYLWIFGDNVEDRLGRIPFALFYLVTGIIGSVVQIVAAPESRVPVVGASGAISGVLGAYIVMFPRKRVRVLLFYFIMEVPALVVLGLWALTQLLNGAGSLTGGGAEEGGVAYLAHVGGFASGVLGALIWRAISPGPRPRGRLPFDY
jgi:membrane associated rhomboid family serine protease